MEQRLLLYWICAYGSNIAVHKRVELPADILPRLAEAECTWGQLAALLTGAAPCLPIEVLEQNSFPLHEHALNKSILHLPAFLRPKLCPLVVGCQQG